VRRGARIVAASVILIVGSLAIPLSASADTDGAIEVGVVIAPLAECVTDCVTPPATGELGRTGLDPAFATALALGLGAAGVITLSVARSRSRPRSDTRA